MEHQADVIIVGTGVAGLFCALQLPKELHILMITKDKAEHSDSYLAQGGISTLRTPEDYDSYFEDTMRAGHYKNNPDSVDVMIRSSPQIIQNLIDFGVEFERTDVYKRQYGYYGNGKIIAVTKRNTAKGRMMICLH